MGIDFKAVARSVVANRKVDPVKARFESLKENYQDNILPFRDLVHGLSASEVLECSKYLIAEPLYGCRALAFCIESNALTYDALIDQESIIEGFLTKCKKNNYHNPEHLSMINDVLANIRDDLGDMEDMSYIKENMLVQRNYNRLLTVTESEVNKEMDRLVGRISTDPSTITTYKEFVEDIKKKKFTNAVKYFPLLLVKNTSIVIGMIGAGVGFTAASLSIALTVCLTVPPFIVASLANSSVKRGTAESYISLINKQIAIVHKRAKLEKDGVKKDALRSYAKTLSDAVKELERFTGRKQAIKESFQQIQESALTFFAPYVLPMPKKWIKAFLTVGWEAKEKVIVGDIEKINNVKKLDKLENNLKDSRRFYVTLKSSKTLEARLIKYGAFNGVNANKTVSSVIELHDHSLHLIQKRRMELEEKRKDVKESVSISEYVGESFDSDWSSNRHDDDDDDDDEIMGRMKDDDDTGMEEYHMNLYEEDMYKELSNPTSELNANVGDEMAESFFNFIFTDSERELLESFNTLLEMGTILAYATEAREVINTVRKTKDFSDRVDTSTKKAVEPVNNFVSQTIDSIKKVDDRERKNRMIEGKFRFRLLKIIRNAIILGGVWAINPAIAAIALLVGAALDRNADKRVRGQIVDELKEELKIVEEKIDDAKADSARVKKYELMRIKNRLEKDIKRIEYRLDHAS